MPAARAIVALIALAWALAAAGTVGAQEPGVTIDPDSPAGKEYALPLDAHRAAAVGRDAGEGVPQPLFGVGITPAVARARGKRRPGGSGTAPASTSKRSGRAPASRSGSSRAGSAGRS